MSDGCHGCGNISLNGQAMTLIKLLVSKSGLSIGAASSAGCCATAPGFAPIGMLVANSEVPGRPSRGDRGVRPTPQLVDCVRRCVCVRRGTRRFEFVEPTILEVRSSVYYCP